MTELETHLLSALKRMEQQFSEQLKESGEAQAALQSMFERTVEDNATLLKQVSFLDNRVNVLSEQLKQFGNLYKQNRR